MKRGHEVEIAFTEDGLSDTGRAGAQRRATIARAGIRSPAAYTASQLLLAFVESKSIYCSISSLIGIIR